MTLKSLNLIVSLLQLSHSYFHLTKTMYFPLNKNIVLCTHELTGFRDLSRNTIRSKIPTDATIFKIIQIRPLKNQQQ